MAGVLGVAPLPAISPSPVQDMIWSNWPMYMWLLVPR
jgi:hypothetical protein